MPRGTAELLVEFLADASKLLNETKKVEGSTSRLKNFAKGAAIGIGGAFAADKVVEFGKKTLEAAEEGEKSKARLENVFKGVGDSTGEAAKKAEEYAEKLSKQIGIDHDTIELAQAKLGTFHAISNETARQSGIFDRATNAAADLAAAGFGTMETNATQLGKALQDPSKGLTALARSGVTFTKGEKDKIKAMQSSGDLLGAQKVVLAAVEGQVKGTAAASATQSQKMGVAFHDIEEQLGTALLPMFQKVSTFLLNDLLPAFTKVIDFVSKNSGWLLPLISGILAIVAAVKLWTIAQAALDAVLDANPLVLIVIAIAALVAAVIIAYQKVGWFRAAVDAMARFVVTAFNFIKGAAIAVFNWVSQHWPLLLSILGGPIGLAVTLIIKNWDTIKRAAQVLWSVVSSWFGKIVGAVKSAASGISDAVGAIGRFFGRIGSAAKGAYDTVVRWIGNIAGAIRGALKAVEGAVGSIVDAIKKPINGVIGALNALHIPAFTVGGQKVLGVTLPKATIGPYDPFNIKKLASGAWLTTPTLFVGGEGGEPELVAPESMLRQVIRQESSAGPTVGVLNVQAWDPVAVARAVANELAYLEVRRGQR